MGNFDPYEYALWISSTALFALVCVLLLRRKLHRQIPWFFLLSFVELLTSASRYFLYPRHPRPSAEYTRYFIVYWGEELILAGLCFVVIYEVYRQLLRSYETLRPTAGVFFRYAAVALLLLAILVAALAPGTNTGPVITAIVSLSRSLMVIQCGLLSFLLLFSSYFRLNWRHYLFGVALGFGVLGSIELAGWAIRSHVGVQWNMAFRITKTAAENVAWLIFTIYLLLPQREPRPAELPKDTDLEKWNQALLQFLHR